MSNNISNWPVYSGNSQIVRAVIIGSIKQNDDGSVVITPTLDYEPYTTDYNFLTVYKPEVGGYLVVGNGSLFYLSKTDFEATYKTGSGGETTVTSDDITDATATGKSLITAKDAATALGVVGGQAKLPTSTSPFLIGNDGTDGTIEAVKLTTSATAQAVPLRSSTGTVKGADPTADDDLATKKYVDGHKAATATLADSATKLATARTITVTVGATNTPASFDGTGNVTAMAIMPAATATATGGVKQGVSVKNATDATDTVTQVNALIKSLVDAGVIAAAS